MSEQKPASGSRFAFIRGLKHIWNHLNLPGKLMLSFLGLGFGGVLLVTVIVMISGLVTAGPQSEAFHAGLIGFCNVFVFIAAYCLLAGASQVARERGQKPPQGRVIMAFLGIIGLAIPMMSLLMPNDSASAGSAAESTGMSSINMIVMPMLFMCFLLILPLILWMRKPPQDK